MHCVRDELGSLLRVIKIALFELVTLQLDREERQGKGGKGRRNRGREEARGKTGAKQGGGR